MSGQGLSTASSRPYPWSPRFTASGGGQSQYSACTIYYDVESDHNVFAFVPPPAGDEEFPLQLPLPAPLPVLEDPRPTTAFRLPTSEPHRRQVIPSFGRLVRRFTASDERGLLLKIHLRSDFTPRYPRWVALEEVLGAAGIPMSSITRSPDRIL